MMKGMTRKQVLVQLDDSQVAALDRLAAAAEDSRSELIRRAIDLYVAALGDAVADIRYAAAYERMPEDPAAFAWLGALGAGNWAKD